MFRIGVWVVAGRRRYAVLVMDLEPDRPLAGVTLNTVRTHLANLRGKLGAETRLEAVMAGLRLGLLELR